MISSGLLRVVAMLVLSLTATHARAQEARPAPAGSSASDSNFVHFETLGNGGLYSLNYTRLLPYDFSARVGLSYLALSLGWKGARGRTHALTVPVVANYLGLGSARHKLELGVGALFVYGSAEAQFAEYGAAGERLFVLGSATVGYRYLPSRGFTFSAGFTPLFGPVFVPWGGLGLGHTF